MILDRRLSPLSEYIDSNLDLNEVHNQENVSRKFMYINKKLNHFWNRWRREYITGLREAHRMKERKPNIIDQREIVLIHEDNVKRNLWKIRVVENLSKGNDGEIRGAQVRRSGKSKPEILNRPSRILYPLESSRKNLDKEGKDGEEGERGEIARNVERLEGRNLAEQ